MWMSLHSLQEIHKINDDIPDKRHDNLLRHVTIQNGISINLIPEAIILGSLNTDSQQTDYQISSIFTRIYSHYQQCKNNNGRGDRTKNRKQTRKILFYIPTHRETSPRFHMDRTTN